MRILTALLSCVATTALLAAQAESDKPYQEGNVDKFLVRAKEQGRPAIVLFNFNLESG